MGATLLIVAFQWQHYRRAASSNKILRPHEASPKLSILEAFLKKTSKLSYDATNFRLNSSNSNNINNNNNIIYNNIDSNSSIAKTTTTNNNLLKKKYMVASITV